MVKYCFLKFREPSHWTSCHYLLQELEACYQLAFINMRIIEVDLDESSWQDSINMIAAYGPDVIIFADHRFRVPLWVHMLKSKITKEMSWAIHTYGCFTGRVDEWMQLTQIIPYEKVKFLSGSTAHTQIIRHFFQNQKIVETLPFPYSTSQNKEDSQTRQALRNTYQVSPNELVLTYSGRISFQKNVHHLIHLLNQLKPEFKKIKIFIAGTPDDKTPREVPHGFYLNHAAELFQLEISNSRIPVTYFYQVDEEHLAEIYQVSDYLVSLSTLYGEDYGRSLIEGLACGTGVIATRWGGHKDLESLPQVKLIDVTLENETLKLDINQLEKYLIEAEPQNLETNKEHFQRKFGYETCIPKLKHIYRDFGILGQISAEAIKFSLRENKPWKGKEFFNLHEKVLQPYWERSST